MTYSRSEIWENGWQPYNSYYSLPLPEFDYDISFGYYELNAIYADKNDIRFLIPDSYVLYQNYPNPFNASTEIYFSLPENGNVTLNVYDILGRKVKELKNEEMTKGTHKLDFNSAGLSSGVYIYSIQTDKYYNAKKMMLLK